MNALETATEKQPARPSLALTFAITSSAVFLVSLDATAVIAAFSAVRADFGAASLASLSWTLNAYTIIYAALLVPAGRWADLRGRKNVFRQGLALFTAASCLCAYSRGVDALIVWRALQAVGAALLTPAALALVLNAFPDDKRAAAVGLFTAVGGLAAAIGPAFASWIIEHSSWRWVFLINAPIGVIAWLWSRNRLAESVSPDTGARPDWVGVALLITSFGAIALAIVQSGSRGLLRGPSIARTWGYLLGGLALLVAFAAWARDRPSAAVDLTLFRERSFLFANLATIVFGVAFTIMFLSSFLFLMGRWGYSQTLAGLAVTPGPLMVIPVAVLGGRLAGRIGHRPLLVCGGVSYAVAQLWYFFMLSDQPNYLTVWLPGQLAGGFAVGLVLPSLGGASAAKLDARRFGMGSAVNNALRQLGGALGAALALVLVGVPAAALAQFQTVYLLLAGLGLATAALSLPIETRARKQPAADGGQSA